MDFPEEWIDYIFRKRKQIIERMIKGKVNSDMINLEFTRTLPAIVSSGPRGLNASIKMVGLLHKERYIEETFEEMGKLVAKKPKTREVIDFLLNRYYVEDKIDFSKLFTLDLAKKSTWANLNSTKEAVLIFFTPPITSYMVKADVEIHVNDLYFKFANTMHDLFHVVPVKGRVVSKAPTYIFKIKEISNKSADKFGVKIYPKTTVKQ
ncbi:MAG: hypothetical protein ACP6IP_03700 [Candidatus Njordarchaeia archaeon]